MRTKLIFLSAAMTVGIAACGADTDSVEGNENVRSIGSVAQALSNTQCVPAGAANKKFCEGNTIIQCGTTSGQVASTTNCGSAWNSPVCTPGGTYGTATCVAPKCGDGRINKTGETCDDGNTVNGDGCNSSCHYETIAAACQPAGSHEHYYCVGNTVVECGFTQGMDYSFTCGSGTTCTTGATGTAYCLSPTCGDGSQNNPYEQCDDHNLVSGDGCSAFCQYEAERCGDGRINVGGETCDDGNLTNGDGCDAYCHIEATCGDSHLDTGEECDDGNHTNGDGCNSRCLHESPAAPWPACGEEACASALAENGYGSSLISEFTGPNCTGQEYFPQFAHYDDYTNEFTGIDVHCAPLNPDPSNLTPAVCGKKLYTLGYLDETTSRMRSFRVWNYNAGACSNYTPPYLSQSSYYVKVYR